MNLNRKWLHEEFVDLSAYSDREYIETMTAFGRKVKACIPPDAGNVPDQGTTVEFEFSSGRPDCNSIIGLARESAAAFGRQMKHHEPVVRGCDTDFIFGHLDVEVPAEELCHRYTARMVMNVNLAPSPLWLQNRLRASGVRPINNIVDIASFVTLEYGQPVHAFDYRCIGSGQFVVREAYEGESLTTRDGKVRDLKSGMLVIADGDSPIGLAGIMGGENTGIQDDTTTVVFEAASFDGSNIRQTAQDLGMSTESSARFGMHLDPMTTLPAVERACELVEMLEAGDVLDGIIDILNYIPEPRTLPLEVDKINGLLGTSITEPDMVKFLGLLEIPVVDGIIQIPSFRSDLNTTADIAAEVGRCHRSRHICAAQD